MDSIGCVPGRPQRLLTIHRAQPGELPVLLGLRREAAEWLAAKGIDQWREPAPLPRWQQALRAGSVLLVREGDVVAASLTLDAVPVPGLWSAGDGEPAMYLHSFCVSRSYAGTGLGAHLLK